MSQSSALGQRKTVELPQGTIHYRECGQGLPIVFIHGLLVNGDLWRKVVPPLARSYRCITPDLPLGSHEEACRPDADLSVPGLGRLIAGFLEALDLDDVTLVANDTGGALTQVAITEHPGRVSRVVLTSCDAYDNFPPALFRPLVALARLPGLLHAILQPLRLRPLQRLPMAFGWLTKRPIERAIQDGYLRPFFADAGVRRDCMKVLRGVDPKYTLAAAEKLRDFPGTALIAWAGDDRLFPVADGRRLASAFRNARLEIVPDSYTFVSEDQPEALARMIDEFVGAPREDRLRVAGAGAAARAQG
jgi:pimeloyl-ACP methyl ester carboxylesterase